MKNPFEDQKKKIAPAALLMDIISYGIVIVTMVFLVLQWNHLPKEIPMHYNAAGEIDGWGGKGELLLLVFTMWVIILLVSITEKFPKAWNTGFSVTPENEQEVLHAVWWMLKSIKLILALSFSFLIITVIRISPLPKWFLTVFLILIFGDIILGLGRLWWIYRKYK